jgi:ribosome biogenesis GTPase
MDRLAIVVSFLEPSFRAGVVDRLQLAAYAGGLEAILVVNKVDLLGGAQIPEEVRVYEEVLPLYSISARTGAGLPSLREKLVGSRTVLAGHSGVGKSSLLNALEPELRLETREVTDQKKGRHTTTRAIWLRLPGDAVVVDTPGLREIASGPVAVDLLDRVYPDIETLAPECRFRDCRHDREPDCAVRAAVERGALSRARLASYRRLIREIEAEQRAGY